MTFIGPYGKLEMILGWMIFSVICVRSSSRRSYFPLRAALSVVVCLSLALLFDTMDRSVVFYYLLLIATFAALRLCFQTTLWQTLLVMGIAYAAQFVMYSVWNVLCIMLIPEFEFFDENVWVYLIYFAVLAVAIAIAWTMTKEFKHLTELEQFQPVVLVLFLVIIFVAGFLCNQINDIQYQAGSFNVVLVTRLLSAMVCAMGIWLSIDFLVHRQIETDNTLQRYIIERQKKEFELSRENINDLNIKCHDLKYQIREIYSRIGRNGFDGLKEIEDCIATFQSSFKTGNEALNVVLSEKARICAEKGITFNYMGNGELMSFMSDMDVYRLFNNAIDNAIEAVEKVGQEMRIIGVTIGPAGPFVSVYFENYYNGKVEFANGMPLTSKENKQNHGFGVKSIKMIADSYGAQFSIKCDEEVFALILMFPKSQIK